MTYMYCMVPGQSRAINLGQHQGYMTYMYCCIKYVEKVSDVCMVHSKYSMHSIFLYLQRRTPPPLFPKKVLTSSIKSNMYVLLSWTQLPHTECSMHVLRTYKILLYFASSVAVCVCVCVCVCACAWVYGYVCKICAHESIHMHKGM